MDKIRVLLVDDHAMVREAVGASLSAEADIEVIGSASDAGEAVELSRQSKPDLVLMDIDMPGLLCFDAIRQISTDRPETKFIILSAFSNDRYIEEALRAKANGYLTKSESTARLAEAVRKVADGGVYFSDEVRDRIVVNGEELTLAKEALSRASTLTSRELEILRYIARGMTKKEIASTMHISVKTVETHSANLMNKLQIHDRVQLARYAIREGLAEA